MVYEWKIPKYRVNAQTAGEELERIEKSAGKLDPEDVLQASRDSGAILHGCFEWDDGQAAEMYRVDQARCIIQNLVTVAVDSKTKHEPVRAYVSIQGTYKSMGEVVARTDYEAELIESAKNELRHIRKKYDTLVKLKPVWDFIDKELAV